MVARLQPLLLTPSIHTSGDELAAVAFAWREAHGWASAVLAAAELETGPGSTQQRCRRALSAADRGLLLLPSWSYSAAPALHATVAAAEASRRVYQCKASVSAARAPVSAAPARRAQRQFDVDGRAQVVRLKTPPDAAGFLVLARAAKPVVLDGAAAAWRAVSLWDMEYLTRVAGHREVPVEVGADHLGTDACTGAQQRLMLLGDYLARHTGGTARKRKRSCGAHGPRDRPAPGRVRHVPGGALAVSAVVPVTEARTRAYLAQHEIFQQIPQLAEDFEVPSYCRELQPKVKCWLGGAGVRVVARVARRRGQALRLFPYR